MPQPRCGAGRGAPSASTPQQYVRRSPPTGSTRRMATKLGFMAGLATGYVLGTRASFQQRARVDRAIDKVVDLTVGRGQQPTPPSTPTTPATDLYASRASA
jgi:hypothetical protein